VRSAPILLIVIVSLSTPVPSDCRVASQLVPSASVFAKVRLPFALSRSVQPLATIYLLA